MKVIDDFGFRYGKRWKAVTRAVSDAKVSTLRNAHPSPGGTGQSTFCPSLEMYLQKAGKLYTGLLSSKRWVSLDAVISCQPSPCLVARPGEKSTPESKKLVITSWPPWCCHKLWAWRSSPTRTQVLQIKLGNLYLGHTSSSSQGKCWFSAPSL